MDLAKKTRGQPNEHGGENTRKQYGEWLRVFSLTKGVQKWKVGGLVTTVSPPVIGNKLRHDWGFGKGIYSTNGGANIQGHCKGGPMNGNAVTKGGRIDGEQLRNMGQIVIAEGGCAKNKGINAGSYERGHSSKCCNESEKLREKQKRMIWLTCKTMRNL